MHQHRLRPAPSPLEDAPPPDAALLTYPLTGDEAQLARVITHLARQAGGWCAASVEMLARHCPRADGRPASLRWVRYLLGFLRAAGVLERQERPGQVTRWRLLPIAHWLDPDDLPILRRTLYPNAGAPSPKPKGKVKRMTTRAGGSVIRYAGWQQSDKSAPNADIPDPLACPAAVIYREIFGLSPTINFAETHLTQIAELEVFLLVCDYYNFRYRQGKRTPRPETLLEMYYDWRDNPHKRIRVPKPGQTAQRQPPPQQSRETNAAHTLALLEGTEPA